MRLTDVERSERAMKEIDLQRLIVGAEGIAPMLGWDHLHIRPGLRANGQWRTSTSGTLARFPDLLLVRARDRRLVFAELKRELEHPSPEQEHVLGILRLLAPPPVEAHAKSAADAEAIRIFVDGIRGARVDVYVWRPSDLRAPLETSAIYAALR